MSNISQHTEWLSLIEKTGPFLALGVLEQAFPQGLDKVLPLVRKRVCNAYEEWREAVDGEDPKLGALHQEWIRLVLEEALEYDSTILLEEDNLSTELSFRDPISGGTFKPTFAVKSGERTRMLVGVFSPDVDLNTQLTNDSWSATPIERITALCKSSGVEVGLVTNGESWSVVGVPKDEPTSIGTWYARIWRYEPITLQAFQSLLSVRRCFGREEETLETLFRSSLEHQNEITDTLGAQVRRAVEVLVQSLDRADEDRNRELLKDVSESELYEAGLTVMMRLVVLLCAEERGLLLLGEPTYDQHYAVSTLRAQLREESERLGLEVLDRRYDAWSRILSVVRAVYGGIEHETLRLPPLGGSIFDPDRFPFLEGRAAGSNWRDTAAVPLPIDNRTVLLLLSALQVLEHKNGAQLLSYEALDVEQIGHVYEGLLERTVTRVSEITLGLEGTAKFINPSIPLSQLEEARDQGTDTLVDFIKEYSGRNVRRLLSKDLDSATLQNIHHACSGDTELAGRLVPFAHIIRLDSWGDPLIYKEGSFVVSMGAGRRETGSHYTPKSLTEPIVKHTLEPLVYIGPAEGKPQDQWELKTSKEILDLKVCDMAMGSAAFLVQACRWLADRVVESWAQGEATGKVISIEGNVMELADGIETMPSNRSERLLLARRLIASRCLYGVDINPMAVELAKLSIWLVTMLKNRPFNFLDHALKCGDSLLGVSSVKQIENFSLRSEERQVTFATANLFRYVDDASAKRRALEDLPSNDHTQIERKNRLHAEAEAAIAKVKAVADCLIAFELRGLEGKAYEDQRTSEAERVQLLMKRDADASLNLRTRTINHLFAHAREQLPGLRAFHWAVEFPEVFNQSGFHAFIGNPPYMGGQKISGSFGHDYRTHLLGHIAGGVRGSADLCAYFLLRISSLLRDEGILGLIVTSAVAEGDNQDVSLGQMVTKNHKIVRCEMRQTWSGTASVTVIPLWITRGSWDGKILLNNRIVSGISPALEEDDGKRGKPLQLASNSNLSFQGSIPLGKGFILSSSEADRLIHTNPRNGEVIFPYLVGQEINSNPQHKGTMWIINFFDWPLNRSTAPHGYSGPVAADYPECLRIVEDKVKPERDRNKRKARRERWWQYAERAISLYESAARLNWALAIATQATKYVAFAKVSLPTVFSNALAIVTTDSHGIFGCLSSSLHEVWSRKHGSYNLLLIRYSPSDLLETFPLPRLPEVLAEIGERYYAHRRSVMLSRDEGLTDTYNRFHDRSEQSEDIAQMRAMQVELDQAVGAAYGWSDLDLEHGFHATKQGERYTLSESARREVLERLLALNHERYEEEVMTSLHKKKKSSTKKKPKQVQVISKQEELF